MSAYSKYGGNQLVLQHLFGSFFDSKKSPVKTCVLGKPRHRQKSPIRQIAYVTDFLLILMMWIIGYGEPSNVDHIGRSTKGSWVEIPNDVSNRSRSSSR